METGLCFGVFKCPLVASSDDSSLNLGRKGLNIPQAKSENDPLWHYFQQNQIKTKFRLEFVFDHSKQIAKANFLEEFTMAGNHLQITNGTWQWCSKYPALGITFFDMDIGVYQEQAFSHLLLSVSTFTFLNCLCLISRQHVVMCQVIEPCSFNGIHRNCK